ncbi:hypothetical protein [Bacillus sp. B15-48]|uniref:hypothetical protein n=1 Tax=Bacillus sp. B15-48 TaxID=1548601 RepID=UPI00193F40A7|nr:hypothetical protein [Bacillus sp. B15-48]MBM4760863.1 hypothetical protein [Bacillus sp. B15-48]
MSAARYYDMCRRGIGRPVEIRTVDGRVHRGMISRVTPQKVYVRPMGGRGPGYGGYGYFWRPWGFGLGLGIGIAFGAIAALAFTPFWI